MPKTLATATVDRRYATLTVVVTEGDSHRLAKALSGKGLVPLTCDLHRELCWPPTRKS